MRPRKIPINKIKGFVVYHDGFLPYETSAEEKKWFALAELFQKAINDGAIYTTSSGMPQIIGHKLQSFKQETSHIVEDIIQILSSHQLRNIKSINNLLGEEKSFQLTDKQHKLKKPFIFNHQEKI